MKRLLITLIVVTVSISCTRNEQKQPTDTLSDIIIKSTLDDFLKNVIVAYELDSAIFIHLTHADSFEVNAVKRLLNNKILKENQRALAGQLYNQVIMPSKCEFNAYRLLANSIVVENTNDNHHLFNDHNYFGTVQMSNAVYDEIKQNGMYYIAVNCGDGCSAGFVVVVKVVNNEWTIVDNIVLWEG